MGLISDAINSALESIGSGFMDVGEWMMEAGYSMWRACSEVALGYVRKNPMDQSGAWAVVTGSVYTMALGIAASLTVLFFVLGWLRESIDIRNNFSLENMFRFFVRYALAASLLVNSLALVTGITECATAIVGTMNVDIESENIDGVFNDLAETMKEEEADGGTWLAVGVCCLIGGIIGGLVIIVCGITLVLSVLSRLFEMLLCIPFAPVAFSGFAGGGEFSQTGIAWIKTFLGYALKAVVIALAIQISFGLFQDASLFQTNHEAADVTAVILMICEYCMPMVTACACVKGAETIVRRCLGLG